MTFEEIMHWGCTYHFPFFLVLGRSIRQGENHWVRFLCSMDEEEERILVEKIGRWNQRLKSEQKVTA